jgi:hypothetical protein
LIQIFPVQVIQRNLFQPANCQQVWIITGEKTAETKKKIKKIYVLLRHTAASAAMPIAARMVTALTGASAVAAGDAAGGVVVIIAGKAVPFTVFVDTGAAAIVVITGTAVAGCRVDADRWKQ